jgi:hypothetical protein
LFEVDVEVVGDIEHDLVESAASDGEAGLIEVPRVVEVETASSS